MQSNVEKILQEQKNVKVIDASIDYKDYVTLDLSATHTDQISLNLTDAAIFEDFIENHLSNNKAKVAFGVIKKQEICTKEALSLKMILPMNATFT